MTWIGAEPKKKITEKFARHVSSGKVKFFTDVGVDFILGKCEGIYMYDVEGKRKLINCNSNGGVFNLGHRNPEVIAALKEAMEELDIGTHHTVSEHRARLAERLAIFSPGDIKGMIFGDRGIPRPHRVRPGCRTRTVQQALRTPRARLFTRAFWRHRGARQGCG